MSIEALNWAMNLAPVPMDTGGKKSKPNPACAAVLTGLANHAGPDGRNAFPSVRRLMRYTRLSERTVRTAIDRLKADGIITPGDPAIVAAFIKRGDKQPDVWDLSMQLIRDDLTDEDIAELERQFPGLGQRIRNGVQPLHPVQNVPNDEVQQLHPAQNGVQPPQERGAAVAPKPSIEPTHTSPLRGDVCGAHGAPAHEDATPEAAEEPSDRFQDHARNSTVEDSGSQEESGRHTRLSLDWRPSSQMWAKAQAKLPYLDLEEETEEFIRYWAMEMPARHPKSARARKPASWERIDWDGTWWNRMRDRWHRLGLDRRAPVPAPKVDEQAALFESVNDPDPEAVEKITSWWVEYWKQRGGVLPTLRPAVHKLVFDALAAGITPEQVCRALKICDEPLPREDGYKWRNALVGIDWRRPAAGAAGGMSRAEAQQKYRDEQTARAWRRTAEREARGETSANDAAFAIIEASMRKAGLAPDQEEQETTPGPALPPWAVLRGEIAQ